MKQSCLMSMLWNQPWNFLRVFWVGSRGEHPTAWIPHYGAWKPLAEGTSEGLGRAISVTMVYLLLLDASWCHLCLYLWLLPLHFSTLSDCDLSLFLLVRQAAKREEQESLKEAWSWKLSTEVQRLKTSDVPKKFPKKWTGLISSSRAGVRPRMQAARRPPQNRGVLWVQMGSDCTTESAENNKKRETKTNWREWDKLKQLTKQGKDNHGKRASFSLRPTSD